MGDKGLPYLTQLHAAAGIPSSHELRNISLSLSGDNYYLIVTERTPPHPQTDSREIIKEN